MKDFDPLEQAELLARVINLLNEGKARQANELIQNSGALGKSVMSLLDVHAMYSGLPLVPIEQMEKNFARIRREYARRAFERAVKGDIKPGQISLDLERRTDFLILLLHFAGEVRGSIKLAKLLFIFWCEGESTQGLETFYNYNAYEFGAFDKDVPQDLKALKKLGILEKKADDLYELTPKGEAVAKQLIESAQKIRPGVLKDIQNIVEKYGKMGTDDLLAYIEKEYPDYAKNSKVKDEHLK